MALVTQYNFSIPHPYSILGSTFQSLLIDASGEKAAFVVQIPKTGTISKVGFRTATVTTSQTLKVGIYTVDGSGDPTTTAYGSSTTGTQTSPASNTAYLVTLGTGATATQGDIVAVVIEFDSTVGNLNIAHTTAATNNFPYSDLYTGTWAKTAATPILSFEYDDGSYAPILGCGPPCSIANTTFNSGSTPDEYALYFKTLGPCKVNGVTIYGGAGAAAADFSIILYNSDGTTALGTIAVDGDVRAGTSSTIPSFFQFSSAISLSADTFYYLSLRPDTANNARLLRITSVASAAAMDVLSGGQNFYEATRTNAGAWTTTTTNRPAIMPILSAIDDGTSTGGGTVGFTYFG